MRDFLRRNSSTILTCIGAVGVVATAVMAVKATPKALERIEHAKEEKGEDLTVLETINVAGPVYIPAAVTGVATIACIFASNTLNKHQQAMLTSAYALLDSSYRDYKNKVDELYGEEAGKHVRSEIAKDKYTGDGTLSDDDKELFYDFFSGRYFESTKEDVLMAEYNVNRELFVNYAVGVNDFYRFLGIDEMPEFEDVGWACGQMEEMYWHPWVEFQHEETIIDDDSNGNDGLDCTIIYLPMEPIMGYLEY